MNSRFTLPLTVASPANLPCSFRVSRGKTFRHFALILLLAAIGATAHAQNVTFTGVQSTVATGLDSPTGVAVDFLGNIYIANFGDSLVLEVPASGGAATPVGGGFSGAASVATDAAGDLFIADTYDDRVVEIPFGGSQTAVGSFSGQISGVWIDAYNNLFAVDRSNGLVVEIPFGGSQTTVESGLSNPETTAVDAAGDLFVAEYSPNQVQEFPAGNGTPTTVGTDLGGPFGVATDAAGNVYIADIGNNRVVKTPPPFTSQISLGSGLNQPYGVGLDSAGNLYIADTNNNRVVELKFGTPNFGSVNVCPSGQSTPAPCNATLTLNYYVAADTTFAATPTVVTQGAPNLDFTLGTGSTCTGTVSAGTTCTITVTFAPLAPGLRMGAAQLFDGSANLLTTTLLQGIGEGSAIAFGPGTQTSLTFATGEHRGPAGVAVDAAGDLFISDPQHQSVVEIPAGSGTPTTVNLGGFALADPMGLAVDGAGDIFIADFFSSLVLEVPIVGSPTYLNTGSYTLNSPTGLAVDGAGDLFIADTDNSRIVKVPAAGGAPTTVNTGGYTLNLPQGLAADGAGNLFVADTFNSRVLEIPSGGGSPATVGSGLTQPEGLAVDGAGDLFITDFASKQVVEVPAGCSTSACQTTVGGGLSGPSAAAVDGAGDVFIADSGSIQLLKVNRSLAPTLTFPNTTVSGDSAAQSVTIQNIGNQPLIAISPGLAVNGPGFAQVPGSGTPADCSPTFALTAGESCNLSISFEPTSTVLYNGTAVFTDNALNASPSVTQTIGLQGTGVVGTVSVPNVVNETQTQATTDITNAGLVLGTVTSASSGTVPSGSVISQNPTSGMTANLGSAVNLVVSTGPAQVSVPNVVGETQSAATSAITDAGLVLGTVTNTSSSTVPAGDVISENPLAGTPVNTGSTVSLVVSTGPSTTQAPALNSANGATFTLGVFNSFSVTTTGSPVPSLTWTGTLPNGVTMVDNHDGTGTLSGTPTGYGTFHIVFKASNGVGSPATQHFTLIVAGPLVSVTPSSMVFSQGYLNKAKSVIVTVRNSGNVSLTIGDVSLILGEGTNPADFTFQNSCPTELVLPARTCKITVFSNGIDTGTLSATLSVPDNAPGSPHQVNISATVINPKASFTPHTLVFGKVNVGNNSTLSTTITNTGTTPLIIGGVAVTGPAAVDFTPTNYCPASLAPSDYCTISVNFAPSATGSRAASLAITDNVGSNNALQSVGLSGKGQ
jgi:sugar lactone lactonase YvrE